MSDYLFFRKPFSVFRAKTAEIIAFHFVDKVDQSWLKDNNRLLTLLRRFLLSLSLLVSLMYGTVYKERGDCDINV